MSHDEPNEARVIPLRPAASAPRVAAPPEQAEPGAPARVGKEPLWRHVVGDVLRRERLDQERTLKDVAEAARISMPYLSELERGRKEASSEVLAAAAHALGLGLADLLALVHRDLARRAGRRPLRRRSDGSATSVTSVTSTASPPSTASTASATSLVARRRAASPHRGEVRLAA
ncbi:helix-turn-helix domain-containing protein [Streptomyces sp. SBT349]|uniref:helix-turn-helix domain-containing protein n=1 Tax=Streptomyces sp. SBT349 TaxID=1580539 RepID=UPI00066C1811|nr:helix-turn-helix transcriptional regulator [Streptomyces sp. SBT349]